MPAPAQTSAKNGTDSQVRILDDEDSARWDDYVLSRAEGTFYHLSGWRRIIGDYLGHPTYYACVEVGGEIHGILPMARVKSWLFGDALISLPFLVYGGPVYDDESALQLLLEFATSLAEDLGVDYLELRNRQPVTDWATKDTYVTFRKHISPDPDENLAAIPRKQRAVIRKALKRGLTADIDGDVSRLYGVLSECKRNLGTPFFSQAYLQCIADVFGDACETMVVSTEGQPVAGVMSFLFKSEVLPYYGGGGFAARNYGANDFMYWKVLERACQRGYDLFDYGRSQNGTGAYKFKKYWGFDPSPLSYEFHLVKAAEVPRLDPTNQRYGQLISAWKRLPLGVARLIGPYIARRLG